MVRLPVNALTIDKYWLSMLIDFAGQIGVSAGLDDRKRLVFRAFGQISARFSGTVYGLLATRSGPLLPMSAVPPSSFRANGLSCPSPPPISLFSGILAADGHQSAFLVGYDRMLVRCGFSSLVGLHLDHKTRLQLVIFSCIPCLYKAPEKRVRKPWQTGKAPIHRQRQSAS
ncbi:hypothetical protein HFO06_26985 [Rhizobium leguminosarum]|uniref:hypothetical protein n=1 Tax=Rhizobium leguminosarum TaxID=384 RepID=UPI001C98D019|nr:hypothetical protein [Rhizobium leguminosarum]MBY5766701.1 hypothetical protein [Rhizobium leguminosarum]